MSHLNGHTVNGHHSSNGNGISKPSPISREEYDRFMIAVSHHAEDRFLQVKHIFLYYLEGDFSACILLAHILNLLRMRDRSPHLRKQLREDGMWIRLPAKEVMRDIHMKTQAKERAIDALSGKGLLETRHYISNILWVRICPEGLAAMEEFERKRLNSEEDSEETQEISKFRLKNESSFVEETKPVSSKERIPSIKNSKNKKNSPPLATLALENARDVDSFSGNVDRPKKTEGMMYARELRQVLTDKKLLIRNCSEATLRKWEKEFSLLIKETSSQQVRDIFDWYSRCAGKPYVPECLCAASFREKFNKLVSAKKRSEQPQTKKHSRTAYEDGCDDVIVDDRSGW